MEEYEGVLIERCVKNRYPFLDNSERERICRITKALAKTETDGVFPSYNERFEFIKNAVESYFLKNESIVPGGFVDFRLREVYYNVEEMVARGADRFFEEKEFEEFTCLLSAFVSEKKPKETMIHILWQNGRVQLLNKRGRDVTEKYEKEFYSAAVKKGLGEEDLAISALISAAPEKIIFHSPPEKSPLKETVEKIFEGKCKLCTGCSICKKLEI